jgi:hypothetical protein
MVTLPDSVNVPAYGSLETPDAVKVYVVSPAGLQVPLVIVASVCDERNSPARDVAACAGDIVPTSTAAVSATGSIAATKTDPRLLIR